MVFERQKMKGLVRDAELVGVQGRVQAVVGLGIQGVVPGVRLGEPPIAKRADPLAVG